ncbi:hypothetical protein [Oceanobacillus sp. CAU 1775]
MDKHVQHIVEDLLPLYQEGLLSDETTKWLENQLENNADWKKLAQGLEEPLEKEGIPHFPEAEQDKMFKKINRKLTIYQFIFIAISLVLAFQTAIWNDSFGFIFWYTVLGFVIYLFYSSMKIVFLFSFVPIFIWSVIVGFSDYEAIPEVSMFALGFEVFQMAIMVAVIHYLFAVIGSVIGFIIKKLTNKEVF